MACAVTLFASCMEDERMDAPQSGKVRMEFYTGMDAATRTQLVANNNVHWETGDAISLFDPSGANNEFTTQESGASVTFTGTAGESAGTYYALYPYSADATIAGSIITTTLPATQTAKAGSFATMLNPSAAVADAQHNLYFKNACALVKFTLGGSTGVAKATLCGNNGEALAGTLTIDASADAPAATVDAKFGETVVELTGTLTSGSTYYFVVAPGTLSGGLTLTLYDGEGNFWKKTSNTSATLTAGRILNLGTLTPDTFTPSSGYEVTQDGVYHIYNAEGLMKWASDADVLNKNLVLENDIDLTGKTWIPIGTDMNTDGYSGEFDGNGKFIYNLTVDSDAGSVGFFGGLAAGAVVHDVKFDKASVTGSSSNTSTFVGVVAGSSLGKIEDCNVRNSEVSGYNAGAITGNNSLQVNGCNTLDVQVTATYAAGGIAGANYGKVEYCTLSGNSRIEASGSSSRAGGIIGTSSKESGVLTSGRLLKCAVDGATISATWAGGIAGENSFGIVAQCIANRVTVTHNSSQPTSRLGGVVGYNTRGDVVASYSAYSTIGGQGLALGAMGGIVGYNYYSAAYVYGCYSTHVSILGTVSGSESGMGSIAGYTSGHVTSCYAILPDEVTGINLIGGGSFISDHCVAANSTDYEILVTGVDNLTASDNSVWKAAEIWDFTASGAPTIVSNYICEPSATQP